MTITSTQLYNEVLEAMDNFQVILVRDSSSLEVATIEYFVSGEDNFLEIRSESKTITLYPETSATNLYEPTNFTPAEGFA